MQARPKIRFDAIDRAQKLLETAPVPRLEEVTKSHAIRILIPQIREAQSKGYGLQAIANMLSESGVPVSAALLKTLLSQDKPRPVSENDSRDESHRQARAPGRGVRVRSREELLTGESALKTAAKKGPVTSPSSTGAKAGIGDRTITAPNSPSVGQPPERRSSFVPRPDTENI